MSDAIVDPTTNLKYVANRFTEILIILLEEFEMDSPEVVMRRAFYDWYNNRPGWFMVLMIEAERLSRQDDFTRSLRLWEEPHTAYRGRAKVVTTELKPFKHLGGDYTWMEIAQRVLRSADRYDELTTAIQSRIAA